MRLLICIGFVLACLPLRLSAQAETAIDTLYRVDLRNHDVSSTRHWANDTVRYHYNQMKYNVKTILPILAEAVTLFNELNARLNDPDLSGKERRAYIRLKESLVRRRFEDRIKSLNETQGVLLIKLTARQTGLNIYQQLADFKGPVPALKWQAWARVQGFNLNRKYHPEEHVDLEHIMRGLGYPLSSEYERTARSY